MGSVISGDSLEIFEEVITVFSISAAVENNGLSLCGTNHNRQILLVVTGFVSLATMLLQAYFPVAAEILGVQLAALSVSLVAFRGTEDKSFCVCDALTTGLFFMVLMAVCALIREVLGSASIWGQPIAFLQNYKISTLAGVFGGYLVLAIVLAVVNKLTGLNEEKEGN